MNRLVVEIRGLPMLARWATIGAISAGVTGGIIGLVVGLFAYAPTAPFAAAELGLPAVFAGAVIGFAAGVIRATARCVRRRRASSL
jgi:hypothetical protein